MSRRPYLPVDRRLFGWAALLFVLIVFAGFARTYYLKGLFGAPELATHVHVHGLVMTLWVALFVTQVTLVARRRVDLHRQLGITGAVVAALVVVIGAGTAIAAARRGISPIGSPLVFMAVPFGDLVAFGGLVGAALAWRRRPDVHRRLMLLSCVALLPPAVARLPGLLEAGPLVFFGVPDLIMLGVVAYDTVRNRRLHPAFLWGGLFLIATQPLRMVVATTPAWLRFASWVTGVSPG